MTPTGLPAPAHRLEFSREISSRLASGSERVVVTGASGWLGQATLEMLEAALGSTFPSRVVAFGSSQRTMTLRSGCRIQLQPLVALASLEAGDHLLVHFAFATRERVAELGMSDYLARNREVSSAVADHVVDCAPVGMLVSSSGAVYLGDDLETNPYGVLKARDEDLFANLTRADSKATRLVVPRLFNLAGPFLNKPDRYVLGSVIADVLSGGPIRLTAPKLVIRSYVHVADLVELCFAAMLGKGPAPDGPFDAAGEREVEVGELAVLVAQVLGHQYHVIERPPVEASDPDRYVGDGAVMRALARSNDITLRPLEVQIEDTARYLGWSGVGAG